MNQVHEGQYYGSIQEALEMVTPTPTPFSLVCSSKNVLEKTRFILRFQIKDPTWVTEHTMEVKHRFCTIWPILM